MQTQQEIKNPKPNQPFTKEKSVFKSGQNFLYLKMVIYGYIPYTKVNTKKEL